LVWEALDASLFVQPLTYGACSVASATDDCIGTMVANDDCVCYV